MKRRVFGVLLTAGLGVVLAMALAVSAGAAEIVDSGYCGGEGDGTNLTWTLDSGGVMTIVGVGEMENWSNISYPYPPWYDYRDEVKIIVVIKGVTNIGSCAFCGCDSLTSITIPNSITSIGDGAFTNCDSLTRVTIPNSVTSIARAAFQSCENLKNITIPNSVTSIEESLFSSCLSLSNITIPNSVTSIGDTAFNKCVSLTSITIPDKVTSIGGWAFNYCQSLKSVTIPNSVTNIDEWAFRDCTSLTDVYYGGTKAQLKTVVPDEDLELVFPSDTTIHYNSTGPRTLDELLSGDPTVYDNDLALIAAWLSKKTYDNDCANDESVRGYLTYDLGFDEAHHAKFYSNNYGGSLAYTVATKDYDGSGADKILVIACQGSTNPYELLKDATAAWKSTYQGYLVYDIVQDFYNDIEKGLEQVVEPGKTYKVLVTGHSLGGAAADLTGAKIMNGDCESVGRSQVFGYTFGAVNAIASDTPVTDGYRNLHHVYNNLDTFAPGESGLMLPTGMGRKYGKFGVMETFKKEYRTEVEWLRDKSIPFHAAEILNHINHDMDRYLDAVRSGLVTESPYRYHTEELFSGEPNNYTGYSVVACPVNIEVYRDGELAGRVVDNEVDTTVTTLDIEVENEVKTIFYPDNAAYELRINAYDAGSMVCYTEDLTGTGQVKLTTDVALEEGKTMTSAVGGEIEVPDVKLLVVDDAGEAVREVLSDGTERPLNGTLGPLSWTYAPLAGTVTVTGDLTSGSAVLAAAYNGAGQMLSVGSITQSGGTASVPLRAETIKLFWTDKNNRPLCASAEL